MKFHTNKYVPGHVSASPWLTIFNESGYKNRKVNILGPSWMVDKTTLSYSEIDNLEDCSLDLDQKRTRANK
jgi:hypothetical protein